ncbi:MAG: hypothetical protein JXR88_08905 [Clostridia bacterium]|nr:hypothetical protein [Clostridia bacterium]
MSRNEKKNLTLLEGLSSDFKWLILLLYILTMTFLRESQLIALILLFTFSFSMVILSGLVSVNI